MKIDMAFLTLGLLFVAGATIWYSVWVQPRNEFLYAVNDCTGGDRSYEAWETCFEKTRKELLNESR